MGHGGAGKTTLTEALLHRAGAIGRAGRVEDSIDGHRLRTRGAQEEAVDIGRRGPHRVGGSQDQYPRLPRLCRLLLRGLAALRVADLAVFVVSAVEGVEVQTEIMWKAAADLHLPRMIFVNKLDRERSSFERTLEQLLEIFGAGIAPLELPIGEEATFSREWRICSPTPGSPTKRATRQRGRYPRRWRYVSIPSTTRWSRHRRGRRRPHGAVPGRRDPHRQTARGRPSPTAWPQHRSFLSSAGRPASRSR